MRKSIVILLLCLLLAVPLSGCVTHNDSGIGDDEAFWWTDEKLTAQKFSALYDLDFMPVRGNNPSINDYKFRVVSDLLDDNVQLFIDCTYSEADYKNEVRRLNSFHSGRFGVRGDQDSMKYVGGTREYDSGFNYPAIVSVYIKDEGCMYALLDEPAHRIVYVYLRFVPKSHVLFDEKYLPLDDEGEPTTLYSLPF